MTEIDVINKLQSAILNTADCKDFIYDTMKPFDNDILAVVKELRETIADLELRSKLRQIGF